MNQHPANLNPATTAAPSAAARIAFIQSCWHKDIVDRCRDSFLAESGRLGLRLRRQVRDQLLDRHLPTA